jgi:hypothetical protein
MAPVRIPASPSRCASSRVDVVAIATRFAWIDSGRRSRPLVLAILGAAAEPGQGGASGSLATAPGPG